MIHTNRLTIAAACMVATLAGGGAASAATWQKTYLEPAVHAWMGVVTLLASDGEREDAKDRDSKCEGGCDKGDCKMCDHKRGERKGPEGGHHGRPKHGRGPHHGHMPPHHAGPHDGPRGDALTMLHDINMRLGRIERMLAARGPGGSPPMVGHDRHHGPHGGPHRGHHGMVGPKGEMHQRMSEMRKKWENASPEEREEMKKKMEARMKEGRAKMEEARKKWDNASPEEREEMKAKWQARMKEAREKRAEKPDGERPAGGDGSGRKAELENRLKRLEAELKRVRAALESSDS
jgi:hypothetical protein